MDRTAGLEALSLLPQVFVQGIEHLASSHCEVRGATQYARLLRRAPRCAELGESGPWPGEQRSQGGNVMAKGHKNLSKTNKPKLTAKQKQAKRAEKRAAKGRG